MYLFVPCDKKSHGTEISFPIRSNRLSHPHPHWDHLWCCQHFSLTTSIWSAREVGPNQQLLKSHMTNPSFVTILGNTFFVQNVNNKEEPLSR